MRMKKIVAALMAAAMTLSAAGSISAAGTASSQGETEPIKQTESETQKQTEATSVDGYIDLNTMDHTGNQVNSVINKDEGSVFESFKTTGSQGYNVWFKVARNSLGKEVPITVVGNGTKGVFNSKKGRKIKIAWFNSAKPTVVQKLAFKGSKVKIVKISTDVTFNKNAFKGTKQKKITLRFKTKKASSVKLQKGSFKGLTKVTVKGLSKKEYKKLLKAAKKVGIKASLFKRG